MPVLGWREHVALPDLGIRGLICKVDTGARTSSLHAFAIERFEHERIPHVRFGVHPRRRDEETEIWCEAELVGEREVTNSGGESQTRYVIATELRLGAESWSIELNLTDRSTMGYRMLLGRTALRRRYLIDPAASFRQGRPRRSTPS